MPVDVQDALKEVFTDHGGMTEEDAIAFLKTLEAKKRLKLETWS